MLDFLSLKLASFLYDIEKGKEVLFSMPVKIGTQFSQLSQLIGHPL